MLRRWDVLVVCAEMRNRNTSARMHKGVSVGDFSCSTLSQTMEVLSSHKMEIVFCDEDPSDGSFRDLLRTNQLWIGRPHIVVIVHLGEWAEHPEALQRRVLEVISSPLHPTDVEQAVIRIIRNGVRESFFQVSA
jgi:DNA-binding NtrC family response regulator